MCSDIVYFGNKDKFDNGCFTITMWGMNGQMILRCSWRGQMQNSGRPKNAKGSSVQSLEIKINMGSAVNAMYVLQRLEVKIGSTLEAWRREELWRGFGAHLTPYAQDLGFCSLHTGYTHRSITITLTCPSQEEKVNSEQVKNKARPQRNLEKRSSEGNFDPAGCGVMCWVWSDEARDEWTVQCPRW